MWTKAEACICISNSSDKLITVIGFGTEYIGEHIKELADALRETGSLMWEELEEA
jgi:hypothetical protein